MVKRGTTRREFLKAAGNFGLLTLVPPLVTGCGGSRSLGYGATIQRMTSMIQKEMEDNQVTGLAIALVDDQRTVWAEGFGYADKAKGLPVTSDTLFGIGSTSKTFTAAMVMKLVEQGRVDLDAPLSAYIPSFRLGTPLGPYASTGGPITIRTMLTQHSGIPGEALTYGVFTSSPHGDFNTRLVNTFQTDYAQYPTDFFFAYSNAGVSLLADVIAAASGMSFLAYSRAFLQSLGMHHTSFDRDDQAVAVGQTKNYAKGLEYPDGYVGPLAAGSIISSVTEMELYLKMIHAGGVATDGTRLLRETTLEAMVTPQNTTVPLDFDFRIGFMWWLSNPELAYAGRLCEHGGDTTLSHTACKILLDHKLGVVVLTNSYTGAIIKDKIAVKALQLALEEKKGMTPPTFTPKASPEIALSRPQLDALTGIYIPIVPAGELYAGALAGSRYDQMMRSGSGLSWTQNVGSSSTDTKILVPRANGRFSAPDSQDIEYEFVTVSGRKVIVTHWNGFRMLSADRYDPVSIPESWSKRLGTYANLSMDSDALMRAYPGFSERDADLTLSIKDGVMVMNNLPLAPVSDTLAYKPGLARDLGAAVQVVTVSGGERLIYNGYQYRKQ